MNKSAQPLKNQKKNNPEPDRTMPIVSCISLRFQISNFKFLHSILSDIPGPRRRLPPVTQYLLPSYLASMFRRKS
jgi:hypothetical protein